MLKRYQVLLPDWLEDYIQYGVKIYGFSHSEIIRLFICRAVMDQIATFHPEYEFKLKAEDILNAMINAASEKPDKHVYKKFVSRIYFETRKAIEYRMQKLGNPSHE